ncbi:MAG: DNA topoisomerase I [Candidatus Hadarchaeales archaeon]
MQKSWPARIWQIKHNGVLIPEYKPVGFKIKYRGKPMSLAPEQEEMAVAWVKKLGTDYVKDPVFVKNFFSDFSKALGIQEEVNPEDFDFSEIIEWVEEQKIAREKMTREERKKLAEERKKLREENREKYGYAIINGERVEIGNYMVEPPCIFRGRGKHPLRGRWKPRVKYSDIVLNLSGDPPPTPTGEPWGGVEFDPNALWIAKWRDRLTGKMKYIWIAESASLRQIREREKFDTARKLEEYLEKVRKHIWEGLRAEDPLRRKISTVAYLIDALKFRVGDEKDKDEADTVGATTLRGSHVKISGDGRITFDFLGKDSVRWVKEVELPAQVVENIRSFMKGPREQIFDGVRSELVNEFLNEAMPGLTAKVFRTYHATNVVSDFLSHNRIDPNCPDDLKKYVATMANLQAAIECHHKRKLPKGWRESMKKKEERLRGMRERLEALKERFARAEKELEKKFEERIAQREEKLRAMERKLEEARTIGKRKMVMKLRKRMKEEKKRMNDLRNELSERRARLREQMKKRIESMNRKIESAKLKLELARHTRDYNLGTSLKSYIDPRVYAIWAGEIGYDWKNIYPKALQKKFAWVEEAKKEK